MTARIVRKMDIRHQWMRKHEKEDVAAAALLFAIQQIGKFDFRKSGNAFGYFYKIISRAALREASRMEKQRAAEAYFSDLAEVATNGDQLSESLHLAPSYVEARR